MNALPKFTFAPAVRERVGLLIGLAGASGSGKTMSALRIARGLAGGDDNRIAFIDTEGGRGLHYAPTRGQKANGDKFAFQHGDLHAPFTPEAYMAAIASADEAGFEVIVIDSVSHSWEGEGGLQDIHTGLVEKAVEKARSDAAEKGWSFNEAAVADRSSIGAWKEPKMRHKRFISRLLQCRAHLVLCFRADEKMRMETVEEQGKNGKTYKKTIITQPKDLPPGERWVPICERRMPYELTVSLILTPTEPGIPIPIKLQAQHRAAVRDGEFLSEDTGRALAEWARGGTALSGKPDSADLVKEGVILAGNSFASDGKAPFTKFWNSLSREQRDAAGGKVQRDLWLAIATKADEAPPDDDLPSDSDDSVLDNEQPTPSQSTDRMDEAAATSQGVVETGAGGPSGDSAPDPQQDRLADDGAANGASSAPSRVDTASRQGPQTGGEASPVSPPATSATIDDEARKARIAEIRVEGQSAAEGGQTSVMNFLEHLRGLGQADWASSTLKNSWRETAKAVDAKKAGARK